MHIEPLSLPLNELLKLELLLLLGPVPSPGSRPGYPEDRAGALLARIARTGALGAHVAVSSLSSTPRRPSSTTPRASPRSRRARRGETAIKTT